jgi:heme/copper-type cytochrome/quinol oxidase subunit 2
MFGFDGLYKKYIGVRMLTPEEQVDRLHDVYGFPEPANENMMTIIDMYHNTVITLSYILIAIFAVVVGVLEKYGACSNPYPIYFRRWQESMVDVIVVLVPIIVVWYLTVPTVGYILHHDTLIQDVDTSFTIEIVGHQWYWTYYLDCIQNSFLFEFLNITNSEDFVSFIYGMDSTVESLLDDYISLNSIR